MQFLQNFKNDYFVCSNDQISNFVMANDRYEGSSEKFFKKKSITFQSKTNFRSWDVISKLETILGLNLNNF